MILINYNILRNNKDHCLNFLQNYGQNYHNNVHCKGIKEKSIAASKGNPNRTAHQHQIVCCLTNMKTSLKV